MVCFRKYGHNELDDPSFTNPLMYKIINARQSVPNNYQDKLVNEEKIIEKEKLDAEINQFKAVLDDSLNQVVNSTYKMAIIVYVILQLSCGCPAIILHCTVCKS